MSSRTMQYDVGPYPTTSITYLNDLLPIPPHRLSQDESFSGYCVSSVPDPPSAQYKCTVWHSIDV